MSTERRNMKSYCTRAAAKADSRLVLYMTVVFAAAGTFLAGMANTTIINLLGGSFTGYPLDQFTINLTWVAGFTEPIFTKIGPVMVGWWFVTEVNKVEDQKPCVNWSSIGGEAGLIAGTVFGLLELYSKTSSLGDFNLLFWESSGFSILMIPAFLMHIVLGYFFGRYMYKAIDDGWQRRDWIGFFSIYITHGIIFHGFMFNMFIADHLWEWFHMLPEPFDSWVQPWL